MSTTTLVDVLMPTYNHSKFVAQAIESVLAQETEFEYSLTIVDDFSTDGTQNIVRAYAEKHPNRIRTFMSPVHIGIIHKERVSLKALERSEAKYIALLEGDDYWTDSLKMKKQVAYFEAEPGCAVCFHNAAMIREGELDALPNVCPPDQKERSTIEDILKGNFIPTCTVMFRNRLFSKWPGWLYDLPFGDWPLHVLNAEHGYIGYINEVMAAYRVHGGGTWSSLALERQLPHIIKFLGLIDAHLNFKYHDECVATVRELERSCAYQSLGEFHTEARSGRQGAAWTPLIRALKYDPWRFTDPRQLAYVIKSVSMWVIRKSRRTYA